MSTPCEWCNESPCGVTVVCRGSNGILICRADEELLHGRSVWVSDTGYAEVWTKGTGKKARLHRLIGKRMGLALDGLLVDHANLNKLDNRRCNIRPSTRSQNQANHRARNTTGFKGVYFKEKTGRYGANIKVQGKSIYLGTFDTGEQAAAAYDRAAVQHFGSFAWTNLREARK